MRADLQRSRRQQLKRRGADTIRRTANHKRAHVIQEAVALSFFALLGLPRFVEQTQCALDA
jgi:hypothetical protein